MKQERKRFDRIEVAGRRNGKKFAIGDIGVLDEQYNQYNPFTPATVEYCTHDVEVTKRLLNAVYGYPIGLYTIENVIFNEPATIVFWNDGTKTVVKCQNNDVYSKETGLAMAICKKFFGNNGKYNDVFKKWIDD